MKTFNNITKALLGFTALAAFSACDPTEFSKPDDGFVAAPTTEQISFTIAPTTSDFRFTLINTSSVKGYAMWDLGNGTTAKGDTVTAYYPLPNNYKIILKLSTNGGSGQLEKMHETTKTDYAIFTDAKYINLSGGVDALNGKTWVLDSLAKGHLGVGPAGSAGLDWWSADPLAKKSTNAMYGDELTFKINGFSATLKNFGNSYVKDFRKDNAAYSNPVQIDGDYVVTYNNPAPGSWGISEVDGKTYLTLTGDKPIFPAFDVGAVNGRYEILSLGENLMELVAIGGDNNAWHYRLIPKGYTKPTVTADMNVTDAGSANTYTIGLSNVVIPAGVTISKFDVTFGDGSTESGDSETKTFTHTFYRAGTYLIKGVLTTSSGDISFSKEQIVAANHPDYVPFLLDAVVMYNDFSETSMAPMAGEDCDVTIVGNPSVIYPNRSSKVAFYSKSAKEWANANMKLPNGGRFNLTLKHTFRVKVYGKAGDKVLLKLENTDLGGNAWQTGTSDLIYTIKATNTWEQAEFDFSGVAAGWDWTGKQFTSNVVTDAKFNAGYYNIVRIMLNPGVGTGTHEFYFDDLEGPHVEGMKSAKM